MSTMEAITAMMAEFQRMNVEKMNTLLSKQNETLNAIIGNKSGNSTMIDTRGIGKPVSFKGDEGKYTEWKAKLLAYLRVHNRNADAWITWVAIARTRSRRRISTCSTPWKRRTC